MSDTSESKNKHIWDLPKRYFRGKEKAIEYRDELIRMIRNLRYTNRRIQYSERICSLCIQAITAKSGYSTTPNETFRAVEEFVYHYENYCDRTFATREKILQFINAILGIGFEERDVAVTRMLREPSIKRSGLDKILALFEKTPLMIDRKLLTHRIYYGSSFDHYFRPKKKIDTETEQGKEEFKKWCIDWRKEITNRARLTNRFTESMYKMNHELASKLEKYLDSKASKR